MVLRRLSGKTENTAPVLTLITQFGGGKTHTLTSLYHLANAGAAVSGLTGVADLLKAAGLTAVPAARVGVFVGNAWDPTPGRETPWIDMARQLAGEQGVAALGAAARTTPPGTEALARVFAAAGAPVLLLFDEVLNFVNRHRAMAESFHAFLQNLTVAVTGAGRASAVVSLPRSQVEMTDWDQQWQERITKVVRRVARDLIANDESEISEGGAPAAVREPWQRPRTQESRQDLRRLVLRALCPPSRRMARRRYRDHRVQGAGVPQEPVRSLLSLSPGDALGLSAQVARARPVPADARRAGDAGTVDLVGGARAVPEGAHGTADHAGVGAA